MVHIKKHEIPGTGIHLDRVEGITHPLIPEIISDYYFRKELVEEIAYCLETGTHCMLVGDAGVGKSSIIEQLAAQLNRPLRRLNMHGESDTTVLLGRDYPAIAEDGTRTLQFRRGPLPEAVSLGYWILIDEIDAALQPVLFCLQQILEENGKLVLEDAESTVLRPHAAFRFFATANSVGIASRNKLLYTGTMTRLNEATLDRFGAVVHVAPMEAQLEKKIIKRRVPALDDDFVEAIVRIAGEARKDLTNDRIACTFSTRRCLQWAQAMTRFHPIRAAQLTVLNKLSEDDYRVLEGVIQRFFGRPETKGVRS